jgi:hypothetical protein
MAWPAGGSLECSCRHAFSAWNEALMAKPLRLRRLAAAHDESADRRIRRIKGC